MIKDKTTGLSKGYGLVHYTDPVCAAAAMTRMNGYRIDGKSLFLPEANLPDNPITASSQAGPSAISWIGPPGSFLPKFHASCSPKSSYWSQAILPSYPTATIPQGESSVIRTGATGSVFSS